VNPLRLFTVFGKKQGFLGLKLNRYWYQQGGNSQGRVIPPFSSQMRIRMKALVVGGSYFVGLGIVKALVVEGLDVTVLNRGSRPTPAGASQLVADREDLTALRASITEPFEVVVDTSAMTGQHVEDLAAALPAPPRRYLLISSGAVYSGTAPFHEDDAAVGADAWGD
jgi:nucleoside-diphosphate-sugar epimerase